MHARIALGIALSVFVGLVGTAAAGSFDLGVGLGFAARTGGSGFDGGWDVQAGFESERWSESWDFGGQLHWLGGWNSEGDAEEDSTQMAFDSLAAYFTARPRRWWLQFKAGLVGAEVARGDDDRRGIGPALGAGLSVGSGAFRVHILDYAHYWVAGDGFEVFSISVLVLAGGMH